MGMATTLQLDTSSPFQDAVDFMNTTYEQAKALFLLYDRVADSAQKHVIADEFCIALKANLQVEAEAVYPAVSGNPEVVSEAMTNQSVLMYLIDEIAELDKDSTVFDIKIKLLGAQFKDHIQLIRSRVFRYLGGSDGLNLYSLRTQLETVRNQLIMQA